MAKTYCVLYWTWLTPSKAFILHVSLYPSLLVEPAHMSSRNGHVTCFFQRDSNKWHMQRFEKASTFSKYMSTFSLKPLSPPWKHAPDSQSKGYRRHLEENRVVPAAMLGQPAARRPSSWLWTDLLLDVKVKQWEEDKHYSNS